MTVTLRDHILALAQIANVFSEMQLGNETTPWPLYTINPEALPASYQFAIYCCTTQQGEVPYTLMNPNLTQALRSRAETARTLQDPCTVTLAHHLLETIQTNDRLSFEKRRLEVYLAPPEQPEYLRSFGPIESYNDPYAKGKRIFEYTCMEIDQEKTVLINHEFDAKKDEFLEKSPLFSSDHHHLLRTPRFKTYAGNCLAVGGDFRSIDPSGRSRPMDESIIMTTGTIKQVFLNHIDRKVTDRFYPLIEEICHSDQQEWYKVQTTQRQRLHVVLHELGHTIGKYQGYYERAGEYYNLIEEIRADLTALQYGLYLEVVGSIPPGTMSLLIHIVYLGSLYFKHLYETKGLRASYRYNAQAVVRSFQDAFQRKDGKLIHTPWSAKDLQEFSRNHYDQLRVLIANGTQKEIHDFLEKISTLSLTRDDRNTFSKKSSQD